eukprot:TRINITY_DN4790_c0_g1_i1.p1 TRINITY_DN4790_c0_g1~~TRINITY_DN4790_c0_g1_i1.p1  ORF type:complete len:539 (-),score=103.90 TRINITY_DN4790_c0_g1_i1:33-1649(-)
MELEKEPRNNTTGASPQKPTVEEVLPHTGCGQLVSRSGHERGGSPQQGRHHPEVGNVGQRTVITRSESATTPKPQANMTQPTAQDPHTTPTFTLMSRGGEPYSNKNTAATVTRSDRSSVSYRPILPKSGSTTATAALTTKLSTTPKLRTRPSHTNLTPTGFRQPLTTFAQRTEELRNSAVSLSAQVEILAKQQHELAEQLPLLRDQVTQLMVTRTQSGHNSSSPDRTPNTLSSTTTTNYTPVSSSSSPSFCSSPYSIATVTTPSLQLTPASSSPPSSLRHTAKRKAQTTTIPTTTASTTTITIHDNHNNSGVLATTTTSVHNEDSATKRRRTLSDANELACARLDSVAFHSRAYRPFVIEDSTTPFLVHTISANPQNFNYVLVNAHFSKLLGYSQEDLCGQIFAKVLHPDEDPAQQQARRETLQAYYRPLVAKPDTPKHLQVTLAVTEKVSPVVVYKVALLSKRGVGMQIETALQVFYNEEGLPTFSVHCVKRMSILLATQHTSTQANGAGEWLVAITGTSSGGGTGKRRAAERNSTT